MGVKLSKTTGTTQILDASMVAEQEWFSVDKLESEKKKLRRMSLKELDEYGNNIQNNINMESYNILNNTTMRDLGDTRDCIEQLNDVTGKQRGLIKFINTPLRKLRYVTNGFTKVKDQLDMINSTLIEQRDNIDEYVMAMIEQVQSLDKSISKLKLCEVSMQEYVYEMVDDNVDDTLRMQAVTNRLRLISGTRINAEQAQVEALVIIKQQQESKYQLSQVIQNVVPILSMQVVNAMALYANRRTLKIIDKTKEITGKIIEQNAKEVKNAAIELRDNRSKSIIDEDKLMKAQQMINEAIDIINSASQSQADSNLKITENMQRLALENKKMAEKLKESGMGKTDNTGDEDDEYDEELELNNMTRESRHRLDKDLSALAGDIESFTINEADMRMVNDFIENVSDYED